MARFHVAGAKVLAIVLLVLLLAVPLSGCSGSPEWNWPRDIDPAQIAATIGDEDLYGYKVASAPTDTFAIVMADGGAIVIKMNAKEAPITVSHISTLIGAGFYNGLKFHRVVHDFVIQAGCPVGDGTGGSGKAIKGEFSANGVSNKLSHTKGVVSMGRLSGTDKAAYNSADSQFFICLEDESNTLDGSYAAFGTVVQGMDVVARIGVVETAGTKNQPINDQIMKAVFFVQN